jgi:hypothetical protein
MNRRAGVLAGVLFVLVPFVAGQELKTRGKADLSEDTIASTELIAWTWMQKPQPTPQPIPPPDKGVPQPGQQSEQPANPQQHQEPEQPRSQAFTGKIVKDGEKYVLKSTGSTTYELAEQSSVKQYENQDVKIVGTLDAGSNMIHVTKIELLS